MYSLFHPFMSGFVLSLVTTNSVRWVLLRLQVCGTGLDAKAHYPSGHETALITYRLYVVLGRPRWSYSTLIGSPQVDFLRLRHTLCNCVNYGGRASARTSTFGRPPVEVFTKQLRICSIVSLSCGYPLHHRRSFKHCGAAAPPRRYEFPFASESRP